MGCVLHDVLVVVIGVVIAEALYDQYRHWRKVRHMRELNRLSQLKRSKKRVASVQSDAAGSYPAEPGAVPGRHTEVG